MRKSFLVLSLALLTGAASFSTSSQAMEGEDKGQAAHPAAKALPNPAGAEWPAFETFLRQFSLSREQVMESISGNPESFKFSADPEEQSRQMTLLGVNGYLHVLSSGVEGKLNEWITKTSYKNFPNSQQHTQDVVQLSTLFKPCVEFIKTALKKPGQFIDDMNFSVESDPKSTISLLDRSAETLREIKVAESMVERLSGSNPLAGDVPSVHEFMALAQAPQSSSSTQILPAAPAVSPALVDWTADFGVGVAQSPVASTSLGALDAAAELEAFAQQDPKQVSAKSDHERRVEWEARFKTLVQLYPQISESDTRALISEDPECYNLSSDPAVSSWQIQVLAIRSHVSGLNRSLETDYHQWRAAINLKNFPEDESGKAKQLRFQALKQKIESDLTVASDFDQALYYSLSGSIPLELLVQSSDVLSKLKEVKSLLHVTDILSSPLEAPLPAGKEESSSS